jgi:hypothetical protein
MHMNEETDRGLRSQGYGAFRRSARLAARVISPLPDGLG